MSLDVYLNTPEQQHQQSGSGIFVRENGQEREITKEEWDQKFPGLDPVTVKREETESSTVFSSNITHNLGRMAEAAGIYNACWRPDEHGITHARQLIPILSKGLAKLKSDPERFRALNASNGWGLYENFVPWVEEYLNACEQNPDALVSVSR